MRLELELAVCGGWMKCGMKTDARALSRGFSIGRANLAAGDFRRCRSPLRAAHRRLIRSIPEVSLVEFEIVAFQDAPELILKRKFAVMLALRRDVFMDA